VSARIADGHAIPVDAIRTRSTPTTGPSELRHASTGPSFIYERYGIPIFITRTGSHASIGSRMEGRFTIRNGSISCAASRRARACHRSWLGHPWIFPRSLNGNFAWPTVIANAWPGASWTIARRERTLRIPARWDASVIRSNGREIHPDPAPCVAD